METPPTTEEPPPSLPPRPRPAPLQFLAIVLAVAAAILVVSGVLYGFATADATGGDTSERFRLLGQAANPFIAGLALAACVLVTYDRRVAQDRGPSVTQAFAGPAIGIAATVGFATVLLGFNGLILDFTGSGPFGFKLSAAISRLATILLAGYAVWVAATSPTVRDGTGG